MVLENKNQKDVLIIDDDLGICEILKQYCINMKCFNDIVIAHDGVVAAQKLRNQKFGIVLLDMAMPGKSGLDLIDEFGEKSLNQIENVVIISGTLEQDLITNVVDRGVKNFLLKPFDEPSFEERITKALKYSH